jgi:hypothetical protein
MVEEDKWKFLTIYVSQDRTIQADNAGAANQGDESSLGHSPSLLPAQGKCQPIFYHCSDAVFSNALCSSPVFRVAKLLALKKVCH